MNSHSRIITYLKVSPQEFRERILHSQPKEDFILFDGWEQDDKGIEWILGWGKQNSFVLNNRQNQSLKLFDEWLQANPDWRMGYLNYDLKNILYPDIEFKPANTTTESDLIHFFVPKIVFIACKGVIEAHSLPNAELSELSPPDIDLYRKSHLKFNLKTQKSEYLQNVQLIKEEISLGNIREVNYCIEWEADRQLKYPSIAYQKFHSVIKAPFSAYLKLSNLHLLCYSPERFISKNGDKILSQPIKGTTPRFEDKEADKKSRELVKSEKNISENIIAVDLARSDLAQIAKIGSIEVQELAEIYSYSQVHQLVSKISCTLKKDIKFSDILQAAFPMASMTGSPRNNTLKLIDRAENMHRDLYSGAVGFFEPNGNFDLNVVIRSLIYYEKEQKCSIRAGSAVTADSDPEEEWEECLVKAEKIISFFEQ